MSYEHLEQLAFPADREPPHRFQDRKLDAVGAKEDAIRCVDFLATIGDWATPFILGTNEPVAFVTDDLVGGGVDHRGGGGVDALDDMCLRVQNHHPGRHVVQEHRLEVLSFAQNFLGVFLLGDIPHGALKERLAAQFHSGQHDRRGKVVARSRRWVHSKRCEPSRRAIPIISLAFSADGRPSGWNSGETVHGATETNSASSLAPNSFTVAGLADTKRHSGGAMAMRAFSELRKRVRYRSWSSRSISRCLRSKNSSRWRWRTAMPDVAAMIPVKSRPPSRGVCVSQLSKDARPRAVAPIPQPSKTQ